jgi:nitroreductase
MPAHPALRADRWFAALASRRSRRAYDAVDIDPKKLDALREAAKTFAPFLDARAVVVEHPPTDLFTGIIGSYGRVTGAPCALVFVQDGTSPTADEHCGYTGEGLVLEARALGLGTCWIGGSFSRAKSLALVDLADGEVVRAISPVGHATETLSIAERLLFGEARPKFRRPLDEIAPGHAAWPAWASEGVRAARIAPSAMNRQPWRFRYTDGAIVLSLKGPAPRMGRLDCGIAMLHFELGARSEGSDGAWVSLDAPDVARWEPFT